VLKFLQKIKPLWIILRFIWRKVACQTWFIKFILLYIKLRVFQFTNAPSGLRLLATNHERFPADLKALSRHNDVSILVLPHDVQALINTIFLYDIEPLLKGLDNTDVSLAYRTGSIPEIRHKQEKLERYLCHLIPEIQKTLKIDAFITCSFFYVVDLSWQIACQKTNVPFFVLHKESLQDPVILNRNTARFQSMGMQFYGHKIFVYNRLAKKLLIDAKICDADKIAITGACRMDPLIHKIQSGQIEKPRKRVTLFSFHHSIGRVMLKDHTNYFSHNPDDGFIKYFDAVHSQIGAFAVKHPDIEVYIKPKWGGLWAEKIEKVIENTTGKTSAEIENLKIVWDMDAQELIESSAAIIGINSTALIESLMIGRPVILPLFEEAGGKYYQDHVYFKKYQDQVFEIVKNPQDMEDAILKKIENHRQAPPIPAEMVEDYLGFFDDQSTKRTIQQMVETIDEVKKN